MKNIRHVAILFLILIIQFLDVLAEQKNLTLSNTSVVVAFSPDDGVTQMIMDAINKAKISIYVAAYSFTSVPIAMKLIEAYKRGVRIKIVLDQSQRTAIGSIAKLLKKSGISVRFNRHYKIQHNKYMIFDEQHVECGSFNYTNSAEKNNAEPKVSVAKRHHH
jgi:phosphatidylserine/phosphatidylglycerophosphate/cardiolipin synthase-like enzyme